jgi:hypothetical protein
VFDSVQDRFNRCDILVCWAGATRAGNFTELPDQAWMDGYALKFFGCVRMCRLFWPMLKAAQGSLFDELKRELVPLVHATCEQPMVDDSSLRQTFAKPAQFDFALHVAKCLGYDLKRGRLDLTHHPFCARFSAGDVRITTGINETTLVTRCSRHCTRPVTPCMSKRLTPRSMARRSAKVCLLDVLPHNLAS